MFKVAVREWAVPLTRNPIEMVGKPLTPRARQRRLTNGELEHLEAAAEEGTRAVARSLIGFAVETGMRKSEILAARWSDIDLQRRVLYVPEAKNGHPRSVPLTPKAGSILQSLPRSGDDDRAFSERAAF